jgi:hypothetical protein
LAALPARHPERKQLMESTAQLYAVSRATLYRLLRPDRRPKDAHRSDRGSSRTMSADQIERLCAVVAAMKVRTTNRKGRHLSTVRVLELLEKYGVDTPDGFLKLEPGRLTASTLNRHLSRLGYDHGRMTREPPAVRFQAEHANALWHFDMSPSDLKQLKAPSWIDPDRPGAPTLTLFLLRFISSAETRRTIRAETTKIEAYNDFLDWISFGGPVIKSGDPVEQEKQLKYASLVANTIMLSNVADMTEALSSMARDGHRITPGLVACLSPYMREHIRRFGQYVLDMEEMPRPLNPQPLPFEPAL